MEVSDDTTSFLNQGNPALVDEEEEEVAETEETNLDAEAVASFSAEEGKFTNEIEVLISNKDIGNASLSGSSPKNGENLAVFPVSGLILPTAGPASSSTSSNSSASPALGLPLASSLPSQAVPARSPLSAGPNLPLATPQVSSPPSPSSLPGTPTPLGSSMVKTPAASLPLPNPAANGLPPSTSTSPALRAVSLDPSPPPSVAPIAHEASKLPSSASLAAATALERRNRMRVRMTEV